MEAYIGNQNGSVAFAANVPEAYAEAAEFLGGDAIEAAPHSVASICIIIGTLATPVFLGDGMLVFLFFIFIFAASFDYCCNCAFGIRAFVERDRDD